MDKTELKRRTQRFAFDVIKFIVSSANNYSFNALVNQLIRSSTSVRANYRFACRGKYTADFIDKIVVVNEDADESTYWLELMEKSGLRSPQIIAPLKEDAKELTAILWRLVKLPKKIKN